MRLQRNPIVLKPLNIESLADPVDPADFTRLCALLAACVEAGASIGFVLPLEIAAIEAYWRGICADAARGARLLLVAREGPRGQILGSAQLAFEAKANGRHRGEVQKLMVFPQERRRGIAASLMQTLESSARTRGIRLLFLDTSAGKAGAVAFYEALSYTYAGGIPGYAVDPDGTPSANAIFFKELG